MVSPDSTRSTAAGLADDERRNEGLTDSIGHTEGACSLDTSPDILDARLLASANTRIDIIKVLAGKHLKARGDSRTGEVLDRLKVAADGDLNLEGTLAEAEGQDFLDLRGVGGFGDDVLAWEGFWLAGAEEQEGFTYR